MLDNLFYPPHQTEHDKEIARNAQIIATLRSMQPHMQAMADALKSVPDVPKMPEMHCRTKRIARLDDLVGTANLIQSANLFECKLIINELIDRVSTLTGCAHELEDAGCAIGRAIEAEESAKLMTYMEGRDEP